MGAISEIAPIAGQPEIGESPVQTSPRKMNLGSRLFAGVLVSGLLLASCGESTTPRTNSAPNVGSVEHVIAQVGGTEITQAAYNHWMMVGAATVEPPKPSGPIPMLVTYKPPGFVACVAHLRETLRKPTATAPLRAECAAIYKGIQDRVLTFLISGYWVREAAAAQKLAVTPAQVHKRFEEERRTHYSPSSFRRLREASRQTIPDLEFAVETQMLSSKLLSRFAKEHNDGQREQAAVPAFNRSVRATWVSRTSCARGFVVPDCKQYHPASDKTTG